MEFTTQETKHRLSRAVRTAVLAAFLFGLLTHLFGMANILHNNDDIWQQPMGYGTGISSGRWLLTILGDLLTKLGLAYNLSVFNAVVFLALIAVSAGFVVELFQIRNTLSAALIGMLFAAFPSVTSVLFFKYTAVYYGIAIVLSVLAAWFLREGKWTGLIWSAVCTALAMGIYQAYAPITISLLVLLLISQALEGETELWPLVRRGLYFCAGLILGVVLYFVTLKLCLAVYGEALSDYQGVDNMGKLSLGALPGLVWRAFSSFCKLPLYDYCGLANIPLLKGLYVLLAAAVAVLVVYLLVTRVRKLLISAAVLLLCGILPIAINFVVIMCPDTLLYTLMVYSFVLLPCMPLILLEKVQPLHGTKEKVRIVFAKTVITAVAVMIFCYAYYANVNYTAMYFSNRQVENYWNSVVTQVRMTEGYDADKQWAVIGNIDDPLLDSAWEYAVTYGGNRFTEDLLNQYSRLAWVSNYVGYKIPAAGEDTVSRLIQTEAVRQMPCWPAYGSIQVIGDTVVIKFQELAE